MRKDVMSRSWWSRFVKSRLLGAATRFLNRKKRAPERLTLEALEDRTLLSVSLINGSANAVGILGTVGDQVWLRTSAADLQYSTDGTNYSNLGVTVTHDLNVTLGGLGQVHLMKILGQGRVITL